MQVGKGEEEVKKSDSKVEIGMMGNTNLCILITCYIISLGRGRVKEREGGSIDKELAVHVLLM